MADPEKPKGGRPESPTTARELDFDDDEPASNPQTPAKATHNDNETATSTTTSTTPAKTTAASTAPAQPNAPVNPREQAELTLREAFPSIEPGVVKAVLSASGGQIEPAFNALLGMSDPDAAQTEPPAPPRQPPRPVAPTASVNPRDGTHSQLEADELYARQLAEHYQQQDMRTAARDQGDRQPQRGYYQQEEEPRERNFIDDDLPEIGENIRKGFVETQQKFNGWLNNLKKRIDGDDDEDEAPALPARRGPNPRGGSSSRRSNDYDRYDADPEEFDNDFAKLQLRDETVPKQPPRPGTNPDLFKPTPSLPSDGRKVSFQEGPPEEIRGTSDPTNRPSSTVSKSKWQPLAAADPTPVSDNDPFTVGDSDDEDSKKRDVKSDDADKLSKAMAEAAGEAIGGTEQKEDTAKTTKS